MDPRFSNPQLDSLGWTPELAAALAALDPARELVPARVSEEQRGTYRVLGAGGAWTAEVAGRLAYLATGPEDWPAVGDWVAAAPRPGERLATIRSVLPRRTVLVRAAAGDETRAQLLAANIDTVLLVTSANREFNVRRIERALALIRESGAGAVIVLSKLDLCLDRRTLEAQAAIAAPGVPLLPLSGVTGEGVEQLQPHLVPGSTSVLLGSSGVGKSTLLNRLARHELQATREIRADDDRGRHATTHRQLFPLPGGAVVIDTPGLRELGLWDESGLDGIFPEIEALADGCRFRDCAHEDEPGCAVAAALESGALDPGRYEGYRKLVREAGQVRDRRDARARHERRQRMKRFAKARRRLPDKRSS